MFKYGINAASARIPISYIFEARMPIYISNVGIFVVSFCVIEVYVSVPVKTSHVFSALLAIREENPPVDPS